MISGLVRRGQHTLRRWVQDPGKQKLVGLAAGALAGFCLSAAGLEQGALPLVMGFVWSCSGVQAILAALGGGLGYWIFWGQAAGQGLWWTGISLAGTLLLADRRISREVPLLIPSLGMLTVSAVGLGFQILAADPAPISLYLLRVALGGAAPWLFRAVRQKGDPVSKWLCWGLCSLALAQIAPVRWLGFGFVAAGGMSLLGAFPCAAITGLALDLAGITPVPMTAVTVLAWLLRFLPGLPKRILAIGPPAVALAVMGLCDCWDPYLLPGLFLGGVLGVVLPKGQKNLYRGQTGVAQVRLEMAASVLEQTRQLLLEVPIAPVDTDGLLRQAAENACAYCSAKNGCADRQKIAHLSGALLQKPLETPQQLPIRCRKSGRLLVQLQNAQSQLRAILADRRRQQEYRAAVEQQYGFLSSYLQALSDELAQRSNATVLQYDPQITIYGNRSHRSNGDRSVHFPGIRGKYYIILCDGMGNGPGAVQEAQQAAQMLRRMLSSGFPAEAALQSLNSLCALREQAGAVTVDLAEISLDAGKVSLYKWGAAASYLITGTGVRQLGQSDVPPGISVEEERQSCCRLVLRPGQILLLVSDGVGREQIQQILAQDKCQVEDLARALLEKTGQDDATVVAIRLSAI